MEKQKIRIIKSYLSESKIEDAIELLMEITDGDELHKDVIVFSSRYHKVVRRENLGTIDDDKAQKEHSQIVFGLISTLNRIEKQLRPKKIELKEKVTIEQDADYLKKFISKFKNKNIKITILGATGVGKTYTVNSLLGNPDGVIGHTYRGTFSPKVYDFEIESKHFNLYDLPGLGDFDDERFMPYYDKPIQDSDCFILVVTPPRLLTSGVRSILEILFKNGRNLKEVVFGINKLGYIGNTNEFHKIHEKKDFILSDAGKDIIDTMKHFIIKDLKKSFPEQKLLQSQIVPYDAISGWNIEKLLTTAMKCGLNN